MALSAVSGRVRPAARCHVRLLSKQANSPSRPSRVEPIANVRKTYRTHHARRPLRQSLWSDHEFERGEPKLSDLRHSLGYEGRRPCERPHEQTARQIMRNLRQHLLLPKRR